MKCLNKIEQWQIMRNMHTRQMDIFGVMFYHIGYMEMYEEKIKRIQLQKGAVKWIGKSI